MKPKILCIAPYLGLKEMAAQISEQYKEVEIDVYQGNYEVGPKLLKRLNADENYYAIITRGGTVETCKGATTLPIIEIAISSFDIIRTIKLIEGYEGKPIILAYPSIIKSFKKMSGFLDKTVELRSYLERNQVVCEIEALQKEGYDLIVGDNIVYETAQQLGINSMLLTSGEESVISAIEEGIRLCQAVCKENVITTYDNEYKEELVVNRTSIENFITIYEGNEISPSFIHTVLPQTLLTQIVELSQTTLPTMITGEHGMCKNEIGYLCCCYGPYKRKVLMTINCYLIPEDYNYDLLEHLIIEHLWEKGGTLFLEDIDKLCKEAQKKLIDLLKRLSKSTTIKMMASSELPVEMAINSGKILRSLAYILDEVRIELEPFKNYMSEMNNMISMYLAKLDIRCAVQSVGMKESGVKLLSEYNWPGNIKQFMRVMNELSLTCNGPYISEKQVKRVLKKEYNSYIHQALTPIDLSGSLKEIEARIINEVMIEEDMNQARVEKRLKISHSTLWRKLK